MFWIYMLRCQDASYYVGHAEDLERRIAQHHQGAFRTCYTYYRRPVTVVFTQTFSLREEALAMERRIKGWSRAKKAALIRGDWDEIARLSRSTGSKEVGGRVLRRAQDERED